METFWPQGNNLNNLGKGPLTEATYQISKVWAFQFLDKKIFYNFSLNEIMLNK